MTRHAARRAATAATAAARRTTRTDPAARGADWRGATVATVGTDGTITTTDGVIARRAETYQAPVVGELIYISRNGAGNWIALGRPTGGAAANGAWTNLPLASGFTTPHTVFGTAQYRLITAWGTDRVELRGSISVSPYIFAQTTFATVPAAARPSVYRSFIVRRQYSATTIGTIPVEVNTSGAMSIFASGTATTDPTVTQWFALDGAHYDI